MKEAFLEGLLYEEESPTLDFKKEQYRFVKATDDEKSEILKDILGFINAWRHSSSYILIGVEDVRGGRGNVVGIQPADHLDDHSLQQFVNNLTNRPIRFHYEAVGFEGKQIGVIQIDEQPRPIYLKKDYGKLKKNEVYVRRGSSTDPTKPATNDEIAQMGNSQSVDVKQARLTVEFSAVDREQSLGSQIEWAAELCVMPEYDKIPTLDDRPQAIHIASFRFQDRLNENYYHDVVNYVFVKKLAKKVRLVIANTGETSANDVRLEIFAPNEQRYRIIDDSDVPDLPKQRVDIYQMQMDTLKKMKLHRAFHHKGYVDIEQNEHETKLEVECGNIQPGRQIWSDIFHLAILKSGEVIIRGQLYASNLPQPQEFFLTINATVDETTWTVDDLIALNLSH